MVCAALVGGGRGCGRAVMRATSTAAVPAAVVGLHIRQLTRRTSRPSRTPAAPLGECPFDGALSGANEKRVRVFEGLDEERSVGVADEERTNSTSIVV